MKKITSKKLLKYGTLSAAALGCSIGNAQVVYTDIDDIDVFTDGPFVGIDIDGDAVQDLVPAAGATAAVIYGGSFDGNYVNANNNAIAGFSAGPYNYASNLAEGDLIDASIGFAPNGGRADLNFNGCAYSNSQFCDGVVDGYIGFSFEIGGDTHFGWMRVDLAADGSGFIVKDYAYEETPNTAIAAGDGLLSLEDNVIEGFTSFVDSNNILRLNAPSVLENISIYNVTGQEVLNTKLGNNSESIDINALSTGVYVARVALQGTETAIRFVKK